MLVYEIRLVVHRGDSGYRARWVETDGQESEIFDLALPLEADDADELRWYLEEYYAFVGAGTRKQAERVESRLEKWGRALYKTYNSLAEIAEARGDTAAAAEWRARRDAKLAELRRLQGGGAAAMADLEGAVLALAQEIYAARSSRLELPPEAAEALAALTAQRPPLGDIGAFLSAVAAGKLVPPLPAGVPEQLAEILEGLIEALAGSGEATAGQVGK